MLIEIGFSFLFRLVIPLLSVLVVTFVLLRFLPGGPFDQHDELPQEVIHQLSRDYKWDSSIIEQFVHYTTHLLTGQWGYSQSHLGVSVTELVAPALKNSFLLGTLSLVLVLIIGTGLGVWSIRKETDLSSFLFQALTLFFISIPSFIAAPFLIFIFSIYFEWLPFAFLEKWYSFILPLAALSWRPIGVWSRMIRSLMTDILEKDFIRTARGKGVSLVKLHYYHVLKNVLPEMLSILPPMIASLLTGSFIVETIFSIEGAGKLFLQSLLERDLTVAAVLTFIFAFLLLVSHMMSFNLCTYLDVRLKKDKGY